MKTHLQHLTRPLLALLRIRTGRRVDELAVDVGEHGLQGIHERFLSPLLDGPRSERSEGHVQDIVDSWFVSRTAN
jgi:hypothetical protein